MNDRSQGAASFNEGEFEVMIHRKTTHDDARGVGQSLQEPDLVRTYHTLLISNEGNFIKNNLLIAANNRKGIPKPTKKCSVLER